MGSCYSKLHFDGPPSPSLITTSLTAAPPPVSGEDDGGLVDFRERCPRFRILVIGKANAGKTTVLQKMCNTDKAPVIHDHQGNLVDPSIIAPTDGRGIHDINNELTFSSNPNFVFHDSPGFEASSTAELELVQEFLATRAATKELRDQLHAIWYCLPTDNDRPLQDAEMSFFKQGTGRVPVIAIFTKYDGMVLKEYNKLRFEQGLSKAEANHVALKKADELFTKSEHFLKRVQGSKYPPATYLRIQDMQKPETSCADLSQQTLDALDDKKLRLLFVSVQQNNLGLSTGFAVKE